MPGRSLVKNQKPLKQKNPKSSETNYHTKQPQPNKLNRPVNLEQPLNLFNIWIGS